MKSLLYSVPRRRSQLNLDVHEIFSLPPSVPTRHIKADEPRRAGLYGRPARALGRRHSRAQGGLLLLNLLQLQDPIALPLELCVLLLQLSQLLRAGAAILPDRLERDRGGCGLRFWVLRRRMIRVCLPSPCRGMGELVWLYRNRASSSELGHPGIGRRRRVRSGCATAVAAASSSGRTTHGVPAAASYTACDGPSLAATSYTACGWPSLAGSSGMVHAAPRETTVGLRTDRCGDADAVCAGARGRRRRRREAVQPADADADADLGVVRKRARASLLRGDGRGVPARRVTMRGARGPGVPEARPQRNWCRRPRSWCRCPVGAVAGPEVSSLEVCGGVEAAVVVCGGGGAGVVVCGGGRGVGGSLRWRRGMRHQRRWPAGHRSGGRGGGGARPAGAVRRRTRGQCREGRRSDSTQRTWNMIAFSVAELAKEGLSAQVKPLTAPWLADREPMPSCSVRPLDGVFKLLKRWGDLLRHTHDGLLVRFRRRALIVAPSLAADGVVLRADGGRVVADRRPPVGVKVGRRAPRLDADVLAPRVVVELRTAGNTKGVVMAAAGAVPSWRVSTARPKNMVTSGSWAQCSQWIASLVTASRWRQLRSTEGRADSSY